jgi:hypothetical protein
MANVPSGGAAGVGQRSLDDPGDISIGLAHYLLTSCTAADGTALAGVQRLVETERVDRADAVPSSISGAPTATTAAITVCSPSPDRQQPRPRLGPDDRPAASAHRAARVVNAQVARADPLAPTTWFASSRQVEPAMAHGT